MWPSGILAVAWSTWGNAAAVESSTRDSYGKLRLVTGDAANQCANYKGQPNDYSCHSDTCIGTGGRCGATLAEPKLDLGGGCNFTHATAASLTACARAAASACDAQPGCRSFALDPKWHGSVPAAKKTEVREVANLPAEVKQSYV